MKIGTTDITGIYIGTTQINEVYIGTTKIFPNLLLDDYSGAAVAFSLRKLRNAYSGSAIRVRRSSDNTEQDIGFVNNQLNTSALTTFCSGTDGFVVTWYDQSGNGRNATQSTASNQPQIVSSGSVLIENSEPTLYFDGTNDCMQTSAFTTSTQPITRIILANQNTDTEGYLLDGHVGYRGVVGTNTTDQKHRLNAGTSHNYTTENDGTQILRYAIFNGSSSQLYLNGTGLGTCNPGSEGLSRVTIGSIYTLGGNFAKANIQEIIIYASDQASNKSGIESNINTYYGVY